MPYERCSQSTRDGYESVYGLGYREVSRYYRDPLTVKGKCRFTAIHTVNVQQFLLENR